MSKCARCLDDHEEVVTPSERQGLRRASPFNAGDVYCWPCWYWEVAERGLYLRTSQWRDTLIYEQIHRFNARSRARARADAPFEWLDADALMAVLLSANGRCAISGEAGPLTFDHIVPLCNGGGHTLDNLRPATMLANVTELHRQAPQLAQFMWRWVR